MFRFQFIWAFALIPVILVFFMVRKKEKPIPFSSVELIKKSGIKKTIKHKIGKWIIFMGFICLVTAIARPQMINMRENSQKFGIDIVLVLDVSGSMQSVDFKPNRLEAAKKVTSDFIAKRTNDRIGLVIFSGTAFTKTPLTVDYNIIREMIAKIDAGDVNKDGTAIGTGISVAANRLKKSEAKTKVMILLTDGDNNAGIITPETATSLAKDLGIKIYTIGVGSDNTIIPQKDMFGNTQYVRMEGGLNEELLKNIAGTTGGKYFRAASDESLKGIFEIIDSLEKTKIEFKNVYSYKELFFMWVIAGIILILIGLILEELLFIRIP